MSDTVDEVTLLVNGVKRTLRNPSLDLTLADYLRRDLGLTGTKVACGSGGCGSCTVTLTRKRGDDDLAHSAVNACITRVASLHGAAVTTVEGLGSPGDLTVHPVQERIHKAHGSQCGFCTPGFVMSMSSMLRSRETVPDIEDLQRCFQGNLCRCTGYRAILDGMETFCKVKRPADDACGEGEEVLNLDLGQCKPFVKDDPVSTVEVGSLRIKDASGRVMYKPNTLEEVKSIVQERGEVVFQAGGTGSYKIKRSVEGNVPVVDIRELCELQTKEAVEKGFKIGSAVTLSELENFFAAKEDNSSVSRKFVGTLRTLASPQIRNIATVGGSVLWGHPSSHLMPIYMALKVKLEVMTLPSGEVKELVLDEDFDASKIGKTDLILSMTIPELPSEDHFLVTFAQGRRKEFDLPVATGCIYTEFANGTLLDFRVIFGGVEPVVPEDRYYKPRFALSLCTAINGRLADNITEEELVPLILQDVVTDPKAPGDLAALRTSLLVKFVVDFVKHRWNDNPTEVARKSKLVYTKPEAGERAITRPIPHMWAAEQACGTALYLDDIRPTRDEAQLSLVQSERAHARVVSVDYSEAERVEGVIGHVDAFDIEEKRRLWGLILPDEPVFATEEVFYYGQVVAGIVAETKEAGERAAKLVKVIYEDLPSVLTLEEAEKADVVFDGVKRLKRDQGIVEARGQVRNVKGSVHMGGTEHFYLEPHGALVIPQIEKDEFLVWSSTQEPTPTQEKIAQVTGLPQHKIVVKCKRIGGGFGGKERMHTALMATVAARKFRRPVRVVLSRAQDMTITGHRHELRMDYDVDFDEDGQLVRTAFKLAVNGGNSADLSFVWTMLLLLRTDGGYTFKNYEGEGRAFHTNTASNTAFRGFGGQEGVVAIETVVERIAEVLGKDPAEVRKVNLVQEGDLPQYGTAKIQGCTIDECWAEAMAVYERKKAEVATFNEKQKYSVRRGVAVVPMKFTVTMGMKMVMQGACLVRIYKDGSVLLSIGGIEMGQGLYTKMIQVAAKALGIPVERIHILDTSTETVPNATPTGGSTGADLNGPAVIDACTKLNERLAPFKKAMPEAKWEDWCMAAWAERTNLAASGFYNTSGVDFDFDSNTGRFTDYYSYGAGCVVSEVDVASGEITVVSSDLFVDVGKSLNPAIDLGQIEGAFLQGQGIVTSEQLLLEPGTGKLLTDCPGTYKVPGMKDAPLEMNVKLIKGDENRPASAVYSSKGIGEPPILLGCAGVLCSVRDAIRTFRKSYGNNEWFDLHTPVTPDRVIVAAGGTNLEVIREKVVVSDSEKYGYEL